MSCDMRILILMPARDEFQDLRHAAPSFGMSKSGGRVVESPVRRGRTRARYRCPRGRRGGARRRWCARCGTSRWPSDFHPVCLISSTICMGAAWSRPGWIISGAPVWRWASTAARNDLLLVLRPRHVLPISPMKPGADAGVAHADRDLAHDLADDRVLAPRVHVGGMRGRHRSSRRP